MAPEIYPTDFDGAEASTQEEPSIGPTRHSVPVILRYTIPYFYPDSVELNAHPRLNKQPRQCFYDARREVSPNILLEAVESLLARTLRPGYPLSQPAWHQDHTDTHHIPRHPLQVR